MTARSAATATWISTAATQTSTPTAGRQGSVVGDDSVRRTTRRTAGSTTTPLPADDLGAAVELPRPARRVVSLVPSLTEAIASTRPRGARRRHRLVHASGRPRRRPRARHQEPGPGRDRRARPGPRRRQPGGEPRARRRAAAGRRHRGVGDPHRTLDEAFASMRRLFTDALGWDVPAVAGRGRAVWSAPAPADGPTGRRPDLARPVDGGRQRHVHRRRDRAARLAERLRATATSATHASSWPRSTATTSTSCCCPTSPTSSAPTTGRRPSPTRRPRSSRAASLTWYGPSTADRPRRARVDVPSRLAILPKALDALAGARLGVLARQRHATTRCGALPGLDHERARERDRPCGVSPTIALWLPQTRYLAVRLIMVANRLRLPSSVATCRPTQMTQAGKAGQLRQELDLRDRGGAADRGHRALVEVLERLAGLALELGLDELRDVLAALDRGLGQLRQLLRGRSRRRRSRRRCRGP